MTDRPTTNHPAPDFWAKAVTDRFADSANRTFIIDSATGAHLSYTGFGARAAGAADALRRQGLAPGDRIGISLPNGVDFAVLYFGCLLAGVTAVPINNALPLKDLAFILPRSRLAAIVVPHMYKEGAGSTPIDRTLLAGLPGVPLLEAAAVCGAEQLGDVSLAAHDIDSRRLFSIHFTSGTTSLPKGVPHRAASLLGNAAAFNRRFGVTADMVMLHLMPMPYMAGFLNTLLVPFLAGAQVVLAPQFSAASVPRFWAPITAHRVNTIWVSPSMLGVLNAVDRDPAGPAYCRTGALRVLSATAPLPMKIRADFRAKYGVDVIESYGLSELLLLTANAGAQGAKDGAVGPLIDGVDLETRDEAGHVLPSGAEGELFLRTPHAAAGYLDYDTGAPTAQPSDWFDTGDIGRVDGDGYLFITGRKKDLIIRGGFNISPRAIEDLLIQHEAIESVAVVGIPHDFYGEEIVAAVIPRAGFDLKTITPALRTLCKDQLGPQLVPDRVLAFARFPVSVTGKILKGQVRDQIIKGHISDGMP